jgi:ABC-type branched-subunit amino acid transport system ATPase component
MEEPSTCGQGLASRSSLPAKLGKLLAAQARILEAHVRALDPTDIHARHELDAYAALVVAHRDVADRLTGIADQMAGYRNLPMAAHDEEAMSDSVAHKALERFVQVERELTTELQQLSQGDQEMLQQMPG